MNDQPILPDVLAARPVDQRMSIGHNMATIIRTVGAVVAGMLVAFILVVAVELFSAIVHPLPPEFAKAIDEEERMRIMCQHVERYPAWVLALVVPAWAGTALAGTWIAGRLGNRISASFVGLCLVAALVCNICMLPYPTWFKIACLIAIPTTIAAALRLSHRRNVATATTTK